MRPESKDDMDLGNGEQFVATCLEAFAGAGLTLGTGGDCDSCCRRSRHGLEDRELVRTRDLVLTIG